jgi:predicted HTH transcriptional regulator
MSQKDLRELLGVASNDLLRELRELMKAHAVARVGDGHRGSAYRYYQRPEVGDDLP